MTDNMYLKTKQKGIAPQRLTVSPIDLNCFSKTLRRKAREPKPFDKGLRRVRGFRKVDKGMNEGVHES